MNNNITTITEKEILRSKIKNLSKKTLQKNKDYFKFCDMLFSNKWSLWVMCSKETAVMPSTITKRLQGILSKNGFSSENYNYLFVPYNNGIIGYISIKPEERIDEFCKIIETITDLKISYSKVDSNKPLSTKLLFSYKNEYQKNKKTGYSTYYRSKYLKIKNNFFSSITRQVIEEYGELFSKKHRTTFPNNYNFKGSILKKEIEIYPVLNKNGSGYIYYIINEYDKEKKWLKYSLTVVANMKNHEILKNNDTEQFYYIKYNTPFIYAFIEKESGKIIYIGQTQSIDSRIKRHSNPTEKDSFNSFSNGKDMADNSLVKAYAFWKIYGFLEKTESNFELFRNFKLSWEDYEVRCIPLTTYKIEKKQLLKEKELMELAEAYIMNQIQEQTPDKLTYSTKEMQFFNSKIRAIGVPLYHCRTEKSVKKTILNGNEYAVHAILERHKDIIEHTEFENLLLEMLTLIRGKSLNNMTWYDIFSKYGLNFEEAVKFAVGLSVNDKYYHNKITGQYGFKTPQGNITFTNETTHKYKAAQYILKKANYKPSEV